MTSCSSTNDLAKELVRLGGEEGTFVVSDEQKRGRGTKGRTWYSARKKGLYLSLILKPPRSDASLIPLVAGLAVKDAIFDAFGLSIRLKWPNDLIWEGKKLGGILCESGFLGARLHYVILGVGLNIRHSQDDFPEDIRYVATSLKLITKKDLDIKAIIKYLKKTLAYWYERFLHSKEEEIVHAFQENSVFPLGKEICVVTERKKQCGVFRGINFRGGLILETQGGKKVFYSAEVTDIEDKNKEG